MHVKDIVRALVAFATAPIDAVRGEVFNVGSDARNYAEAEIVAFVRKHVPGVELEERDVSFGGDMRDVAVSCRKISERLGFRTLMTVEDGIKVVRDAITGGLIQDPHLGRYRNHGLVVR